MQRIGSFFTPRINQSRRLAREMFEFATQARDFAAKWPVESEQHRTWIDAAKNDQLWSQYYYTRAMFLMGLINQNPEPPATFI